MYHITLVTEEVGTHTCVQVHDDDTVPFLFVVPSPPAPPSRAQYEFCNNKKLIINTVTHGFQACMHLHIIMLLFKLLHVDDIKVTMQCSPTQ